MEGILFYIFSAFSVIGAIALVAFRNPVSSAMSMVASFLGLAALFIGLNAYFVGIIQILVYAGAIMVLFVFVVMMLNLGQEAVEQEKKWLKPGIWTGPAILSALLLAQLLYALFATPSGAAIGLETVDAKAVGISLFGPYLLVVELASMLLLAALVAAYHLGRHEAKEPTA